MAIWNRVQSLIFGSAIGAAGRTAIEPQIEPARQHAWSRNRNRVLDPNTAARLVAQAAIEQPIAVDEAARNGFAENRLNALIYLAQTAPPVAEALELWRRGLFGDPQSAGALAKVNHAFAKAQIEPQYWEPLRELFYGRLDPAIIATAIQRGIMRDPGFLPVGPPTATGTVPAFPVSRLDPIEEARAQGIDSDRLFIETAIVGLPLSLQEAASAYFRGIIELADFERAVAEGNTRNEWGAAALAQARQILTASQYCELQLRGYLNRAQRLALTAKHGMSDADSDHLFDVLGRSINVHQIVTAEARGGVYNGPADQIPEAFLRSLQRGNLRPEYYNLAYANRYSYPSAFVIRGLLAGGALSADQGHDLFLQIGWPPTLARQVADFYGAGTTGGADKHVAKAETQLWTTLHTSYRADETDAATASATLGTLGVSAAAIPQVLALWDAEKALRRKQLTPAQVKKAYRGAITNQDTGAPYTRDDALAALLERGYSTAQANEFLDL